MSKPDAPSEGRPSSESEGLTKLSKEQCIEVVKGLVACEFNRSAGRWAEPQAKGAAPGGRVKWRVPTSLFIGVTVREFGDKKVRNQAKDRDEVPVNVWNAAEKRRQDESIRGGDVFTGVVLRGGGVYGFATSDLNKLPATVFKVSVKPQPVSEGDVAKLVRVQATELRDQLHAAGEGAYVAEPHLAQLNALASGAAAGEEVVKAVTALVQADPSSKMDLCARAYAGGVWRAAVSARAFAAAYGSTDFELPEMFGSGKWQAYGAASPDDVLVGFELRNDGSTSYVRLTRSDLGPGYKDF